MSSDIFCTVRFCFYFRQQSERRTAEGIQRVRVAVRHAPVPAAVSRPGLVQPGELQSRKRGWTTQVQLPGVQRRAQGLSG